MSETTANIISKFVKDNRKVKEYDLNEILDRIDTTFDFISEHTDTETKEMLLFDILKTNLDKLKMSTIRISKEIEKENPSKDVIDFGGILSDRNPDKVIDNIITYTFKCIDIAERYEVNSSCLVDFVVPYTKEYARLYKVLNEPVYDKIKETFNTIRL